MTPRLNQIDSGNRGANDARAVAQLRGNNLGITSDMGNEFLKFLAYATADYE